MLSDFISLFYPRICEGCGHPLLKHEETICTGCEISLPRTEYSKELINPVMKIFLGRVDLQAATALYFFHKGNRLQGLMHKLKYNGIKEIGIRFGNHLGKELKEAPLFSDIDVVLPIPLHPKKQKKRGYNQAEMIGQGLAKITGKELIANNLYRGVNTTSQTNKNREERWKNVEKAFLLKEPKEIEGKHILLVDDVVTTGATIEACTQSLKQITDKVSVATVAYAH